EQRKGGQEIVARRSPHLLADFAEIGGPGQHADDGAVGDPTGQFEGTGSEYPGQERDRRGRWVGEADRLEAELGAGPVDRLAVEEPANPAHALFESPQRRTG